MTFTEYQRQAMATAIYPGAGTGTLEYPALGLCSEAGEVAGKVKKIIRDDGGKLTDKKRAELAEEIADCLWYLAALCYESGINMNYAALDNLRKLEDREARGVLGGSGDKR